MIKETINGHEFMFKSHPDLFSPKQVDKGTLSMLSVVNFEYNFKVLDLGCGYGVVGIFAAKYCNPTNVFLVDINKTAIEIAQTNISLNDVKEVNVILSNAYENLDEKDFDIILSNPPYHTDFSVAKTFIEKGFNRLRIGGRFFMVTKRNNWYKNKFTSIFGGTKIHTIDGYYVFEAEKRGDKYAKSSNK